MAWRNAIKLSKIKSGNMRMLNLGTKIIMIYRDEDDFHATEGLCRHMRWLLWGGKIEDGCITCPLHQTRHRLDDGELMEWAPFPLSPYGKFVGKLSRKKKSKNLQNKKDGRLFKASFFGLSYFLFPTYSFFYLMIYF